MILYDRSEMLIVECRTMFGDVQREPNIIIACETDVYNVKHNVLIHTFYLYTSVRGDV